ncbi:AraC family transcriptional regulator [Pokkaliibacter plantistimulans]|uniref:AraC family transcriptional regulator n=1 Tax=Proteobacteria bacterium 228 TaxID=2083153 RepID=A0A2S5KI94_9PROT|nr:helix-turn-helix domain-containing protein [Pokkaliibacter plantistimulans]PPC74531.1 AraC family transcriptional regulator [Pokkaliibacter plantistimulans]
MLTAVTEPTASQVAGLHHLQTGDIEEHAGGLNGWEVRYNQLTLGRFVGSITEVQLDGVQLIRDRANQAMIKNGAAWDGAITFSLPLAYREHSLYCAGNAISMQGMLVAHGASLPELRVPAGVDLLCVAIEQQRLEQIREHQQRSFSSQHAAHCYGYPADIQHELAMLTRCLMDVEQQGQTLLSHRALRTGLRDTVLMLLLDLLENDEAFVISPNARKRIVDRACDYVLACRDEPPSIIDLCNKIGASRRKLQYCFHETLGINPVAYLRTLRLNEAHRALLQADSTTTVQDVAACWGFWHLSRFATDYRQLFGERPSDTLRRHRQQS